MEIKSIIGVLGLMGIMTLLWKLLFMLRSYLEENKKFPILYDKILPYLAILLMTLSAPYGILDHLFLMKLDKLHQKELHDKYAEGYLHGYHQAKENLPSLYREENEVVQ